MEQNSVSKCLAFICMLYIACVHTEALK
ncbi:rCG46769 [Rattus norvegicus]|uniref:RCG46769 n=1 Tax=Rattus norvegicus TaxID=10116 RepID=A6IX16_RAT|nr:rCG46769 [Rattus norvegicus]